MNEERYKNKVPDKDTQEFEASVNRVSRAHNALLTKLFGFVPENPGEYIVSHKEYIKAMEEVQQEFRLVEGDPDFVLFILEQLSRSPRFRTRRKNADKQKLAPKKQPASKKDAKKSAQKTKLRATDQQSLRQYVLSHVIRSRAITSQDLLDILEKNEPELLRRLSKASGKIGPAAYCGRYLFPKFRKEGWLTKADNGWKTNIAPERCAYFFKPLNEVYYITANMRFCDDDCVDKFDWDSYDGDEYDCCPPYGDEYASLFAEFKLLYPDCVS